MNFLSSALAQLQFTASRLPLPNTCAMISAYVMPGLRTKIKDLKRIVSVSAITSAVTDYYGINIDELRLVSRKTKRVQARYVLCYLLRKHTTMTLNDVAQYLSPAINDHSMVIYGCNEIKGQLSLKHENEVKNILNEIYI